MECTYLSIFYRGQLEFVFSKEPVELDQVEDAASIVKRFATGKLCINACLFGVTNVLTCICAATDH